MVSVTGGVLLVMGREGDGPRYLNDVQIFNGWAWHMGPPLHWLCVAMSAVVHGDLVSH